ncbi:hypothetical protein BGZ91_000202 [Linnemannia elongata]|nr:hypothetical protein BGZ91_000202 [Linnemannia elongata]KAG0080410.1 hypothetical protein BGZ90_012422 [Linnemannia elongata]
MVLKSSFTILVVATLAVFSSYTPQAEAHSYADCIDWKFNKGGKQDWSDQGGKCTGYARRFPLGKDFGSLDSNWPPRHYLQDRNNPNAAAPCNTAVGATLSESQANPTSQAYGGQFGRMTVTSVGDTLCVRWPAKNHAQLFHPNNKVQIHLSKARNAKDITQQELLKNTIANLNFKNCNPGSNEDRRPCGGCFKVPVRAKGTYLLQWRWMLNQGEWYTSCADIQIK